MVCNTTFLLTESVYSYSSCKKEKYGSYDEENCSAFHDYLVFIDLSTSYSVLD